MQRLNKFFNNNNNILTNYQHGFRVCQNINLVITVFLDLIIRVQEKMIFCLGNFEMFLYPLIPLTIIH